MIIRTQQMKIFEEAAEYRFIAFIERHLHAHHKDAVQALSAAELRAGVKAGLTKARDYGIQSQSSLLMFVALTFSVGREFDLQPRIHQILMDPAFDPDDRVAQLRFRAEACDWAQAAGEQ